MSQEWKSVIKKLPWLLLIPAGFLWPVVLCDNEALVERVYSEKIYPVIKDILCGITSLTPFSFAEWVLYGLILFVPLFVVIRLVRTLLKRISIQQFLSGILSILILGGALLNWFYVSWGINYFRQPLAERMALSVESRPVEELERLAETFAKEAGRLRSGLSESQEGVFQLRNGTQSMLDDLPRAYDNLAKTVPQIKGKVTRAKNVLWSEKLSWRGTAGIYIGMTAEPNVNINQPALLLPQAAAHEMAHQLGIASENEAEFIAHLVCTASSDPDVRYSGLMYGLIITSNALLRTDREAYNRLRALYTPSMERDLNHYRTYWDAYDGEEQKRADAQNDRYLKFNAQESGVLSYGEAVDLLLAYYAQTKN